MLEAKSVYLIYKRRDASYEYHLYDDDSMDSYETAKQWVEFYIEQGSIHSRPGDYKIVKVTYEDIEEFLHHAE